MIAFKHHCPHCGLYVLFGDRRYQIKLWPLQIIVSHKACGGPR